MRGKTAVVIGVGSAGSQIAQRAQPERLKTGACSIAVSRGPLYDMAALARNGSPARASTRPTSSRSTRPPLWRSANVVTPHMAWQGDGIGARQLELISGNVARFLNGEPLRNVADKQ